MAYRVNLGCGASPTPGWVNLDNSWTVRLASRRLLWAAGSRLGLFNVQQEKFAAVCREKGIRWADVTKGIPLAEKSSDIVYSSHMLEHLPRQLALQLLKDVSRVLVPGGWVRLVLPDLARLVERYARERDADLFVRSTLLGRERSNGTSMLARVKGGLVGDREHSWMYDARSLCSLLIEAGFPDPQVLRAGETRIPDPGPLDLREREDESLYVEAMRSGAA